MVEVPCKIDAHDEYETTIAIPGANLVVSPGLSDVGDREVTLVEIRVHRGWRLDWCRDSGGGHFRLIKTAAENPQIQEDEGDSR
jgi:hypothetical protein